MKTFFIGKVRYRRETDRGFRLVTEQYLVDAVSFADAEYKLTEELRPYAIDSFEVRALSRASVEDVIFDTHNIASSVNAESNKIIGRNQNISSVADKWFKCKVNFVSVNEESGIETKTTFYYYVNANTINAAHELLDSYHKKHRGRFSLRKDRRNPYCGCICKQRLIHRLAHVKVGKG